MIAGPAKASLNGNRFVLGDKYDKRFTDVYNRPPR